MAIRLCRTFYCLGLAVMLTVRWSVRVVVVRSVGFLLSPGLGRNMVRL